MPTVIQNKKQLIAYLEATPLLAEERTALGDEFNDWPEVLKELCKQVWRTDPRPPGYGKDWEPWLKAHLEGAVQEAISIVL